MASPSCELAKPASDRYGIMVIGRDAVFLVDRKFGHKVYIGSGKPLSRPDLRRYVCTLNDDLRNLPACDFFAKYGLRG